MGKLNYKTGVACISVVLSYIGDCITGLKLRICFSHYLFAVSRSHSVGIVVKGVGVIVLTNGDYTGIVPVGEYDYSNTFDDNTDAMTAANGEQVMAKAYSQLKPGDAITYIRKNNGNARHTRLIVELPHVEYTSNDKGEQIFDMEKSYVTILDQAGGDSSRFIKEENKSSFREVNYNFEKLYTEGSLPVSIPELTEGAYVEENTYVELLGFANGVFSGTVKTNRQIISARAVISDGENTRELDCGIVNTDGKVTNYHLGEYDLSKLDLAEAALVPGKEYSLDLYVCTSGNNGAEAKLVDDYKFTA